MSLPISSYVSRPSTLLVARNGELPADVLVRVPLDDGRTALMEKTAGRALVAMMAAARKAIPGIRFRHVGDYRSLQAQINLFESRMLSVDYDVYAKTAPSHRRIWRDAVKHGHRTIYFIRVRGAACATPGTSNHGWGLAIDVAEEYTGDSAPDPISQKLVNWLIANAHRFGFSAELQSEPWHWRYYTGDNIPEAVLAYERGTQQEGKDVKIIAPERFVDTRGGNDIYKVQAGTEHTKKVPGAAGQQAAQLTFTALLADDGGFLSVWAEGDRPETSFLNFSPGSGVVTETLFVPLAADGSFRFFSSARVHVIIDSTGVLLS